jgi:hypothetical protein
MDITLSDSFLILIKQNKIQNITPSNQNSKDTKGYKRPVKIAQEFFQNQVVL